MPKKGQSTSEVSHARNSVIFVNEDENKNGEKGKNNKFVNGAYGCYGCTALNP